jgi:2OG-Fe(II) oxygenase superfamily
MGQNMINRDFLKSWIQVQHLEDAVLQQYRHAFLSHPARLLRINDFLQPDVAERLSRFLREEAEFVTEFGLYSVEGAVGEEQWLAASHDDRFFRLRKLKGTAREFQVSRNALTYVQFRQAFQRPEFRAFFEAMSDLSLAWSDDFGSHSMLQGDFLRPHSDDNRNRQLALVIYLSPGWEADFGGVLHMVDKDGHDTILPPVYNSLVAFDVLTDSQHFVSPVTPAAGPNARLSIGGWYHRVAS